jgi:hypothetical protein
MSEIKGNPKTFYVYADNDGSGTTTKHGSVYVYNLSTSSIVD